MKRLHAALTVILIVVLVVSYIQWRRAQRQLEQKLQTLTDANSTLKESLGELTTAITEREKQIDDLQRTPRPSFPPALLEKKKASANAL
jgi:predicted  nucleic acid-binding Zn-ribbon protein